MAESEVTLPESQLDKEIPNLMETLALLDKDSTKSLDIIKEHGKRIEALLVTINARKCNTFPIHQLLSVYPLTRIEIPLDILAMLASKLDVDQRDDFGMTCLTQAICYRHFNVVTWLVQHGADCNRRRLFCSRTSEGSINLGNEWHSPITELTFYPDVPLDLFDLLKTENNLNCRDLGPLPLHSAVQECRFDYAWRLIQMGASIDTLDEDFSLPIYTNLYIA